MCAILHDSSCALPPGAAVSRVSGGLHGVHGTEHLWHVCSPTCLLSYPSERSTQQCSVNGLPCEWVYRRGPGETNLYTSSVVASCVSIFLVMTHPCAMSRRTYGSKQSHAVIDSPSCSGSYTPLTDFRSVSKGQWSQGLTKVDHCTDVSAPPWSRRTLAIGVSLGRHILGGFVFQETDALDMATTGLCSSRPVCPLAPTSPCLNLLRHKCTWPSSRGVHAVV